MRVVFVIVGEFGDLDMTVIPQTQFTPLPEALCLIVSELSSHSNKVPTLEAIQEKLQHKFPGMQQPSEQIVYETLDAMMKERKIYHTGQ